MERSQEIRMISGLSRAAFGRKYSIPIRTLEDWDAGKSKAPEYVLNLLERVVKEDARAEKIENIRKSAQSNIDHQKKLADQGKDFSAGAIIENERLRDKVALVAEQLTDSERSRIKDAYKSPSGDMTSLKDIKQKYDISWSELKIIARTC